MEETVTAAGDRQGTSPYHTAGEPPKMLRDMMRENPEAFRFDGIQPMAEHAGEIASLETMLGEHTRVRGNFYSRPLKAKQQKSLMRLAKQVQEAGEGDPLGASDAITDALRQILCVEHGEQFRECTTDEIDEAFSMQEQAEILRDVAGIYSQEAPEGGGGPK